jgi:hypothetical protein
MYSFGVTLPRAGLFSDLITDAFIIAIIGFVINISQAKLLAKKNSYAVHPDQVRIHPIAKCLRSWIFPIGASYTKFIPQFLLLHAGVHVCVCMCVYVHVYRCMCVV